MPQIPTLSTSQPGSEALADELKPSEASSELLQSLDTLLEQYLYLLDRQQELQSGLSKQLSSGFLHLAHANYTCPPGRRYDSDYYDERMKATRKILIQHGQDATGIERTEDPKDETDSQHSHDFEYNFRLESISNLESEEVSDDKDGSEQSTTNDAKTEASSQVEDATPIATGDPASTASRNPGSESDIDFSTPEAPKNPRKKFRSDDPIHWYGILVPPSLRTAQKSFTDAMESQVPKLAGAVVEMRALEQKIAQLRTELRDSLPKNAGSQ